MSLSERIKQLADFHGWQFSEQTYPNRNVIEIRVAVKSNTSDRLYAVYISSSPWTTPFIAILNTGISAHEWSGLSHELTSLLADLPSICQRPAKGDYGLLMVNPTEDRLVDYINTAVEGADRLHNAIDLVRHAVNRYRNELIKSHDGQPGDLI